MIESTNKVPHNNSISGNLNNKTQQQDSKIVAYRLPAKVYPLYEEIAKQLHHIGYIPRPDVTAFAKFSLNYMAELWVQEQAKLAKMQKEQVGERSAVGNSVVPGYGNSTNSNPSQNQKATRHA